MIQWGKFAWLLEGLSDSMSRGARVGCWAKSVMSNIFSFRRPTVHQVFVCMCVCIKVCVYQGQDSSVGFKITNIKSIEFQGLPFQLCQQHNCSTIGMDHVYAIFGGKSSNPFVRLQASANFFRLRPPPFYRLRPPPPHLIMGLILSMCILLDHWPFLITACSVWNWKVSAICANGKWQSSRDEAMFLISSIRASIRSFKKPQGVAFFICICPTDYNYITRY